MTTDTTMRDFLGWMRRENEAGRYPTTFELSGAERDAISNKASAADFIDPRADHHWYITPAGQAELARLQGEADRPLWSVYRDERGGACLWTDRGEALFWEDSETAALYGKRCAEGDIPDDLYVLINCHGIPYRDAPILPQYANAKAAPAPVERKLWDVWEIPGDYPWRALGEYGPASFTLREDAEAWITKHRRRRGFVAEPEPVVPVPEPYRKSFHVYQFGDQFIVHIKDAEYRFATESEALAYATRKRAAWEADEARRTAVTPLKRLAAASLSTWSGRDSLQKLMDA